MIEVIRVYVRDNRNGSLVVQELTVGFISLNNEVLTGSKSTGGAKGLDYPAIYETWIGSKLVQGRDHHAGRGGLAMGSRHRN